MPENNQPYLFTWSAAKLLTIGAVQRLNFNRSRYDETSSEHDGKQSLEADADSVISELHAYLNVQLQFEKSGDEAFLTGCFLIINKLDNLLHRLHHTLLNYDAEIIVDMIQIIDEERKRWSTATINDIDDFPSTSEVSASIRNMFRLERSLNRLP